VIVGANPALARVQRRLPSSPPTTLGRCQVQCDDAGCVSRCVYLAARGEVSHEPVVAAAQCGLERSGHAQAAAALIRLRQLSLLVAASYECEFEEAPQNEREAVARHVQQRAHGRLPNKPIALSS
jgi:hypothetical protein